MVPLAVPRLAGTYTCSTMLAHLTLKAIDAQTLWILSIGEEYDMTLWKNTQITVPVMEQSK